MQELETSLFLKRRPRCGLRSLVQSETLLNNIFLKDFRQEMSFVQDDKRLSFEQTKAAEAFVFFCLSHS